MAAGLFVWITLSCVIFWTFFKPVWGQQHYQDGDRFVYSSEYLRSLQSSATLPIDITDFPPEMLPNFTGYQDRTAKKKERKRGKRGGVQRRLRKYGLGDRRRAPPLPSVLLANVQSLRNKTDELEAYVTCRKEYRETCLFAFTETWLGDRDTDHDLHITGFGTPIRLDRSQEITRKSTGGGVCFYVNERYCKTVVVREKVCTPDIELLSISLRPHYLPREFPQLFFTLVYIHPRANAVAASQLIADVTHKLDSISPDAPKFILGDFNHCNLKKTVKNYEQYVTCPTTLKETTLDLCFGTVPQAYKSRAMPSFGASYHNAVFLAPVYRPVFERVERVVKTVKQWTDDSVECLKGCFDCTVWEVFYDACESLDELTDVVSSYISFCVDAVIPSKQTVIYPNNKPWVTKELKSVLNKKKRVFYTGFSVLRALVSRLCGTGMEPDYDDVAARPVSNLYIPTHEPLAATLSIESCGNNYASAKDFSKDDYKTAKSEVTSQQSDLKTVTENTAEDGMPNINKDIQCVNKPVKPDRKKRTVSKGVEPSGSGDINLRTAAADNAQHKDDMNDGDSQLEEYNVISHTASSKRPIPQLDNVYDNIGNVATVHS